MFRHSSFVIRHSSFVIFAMHPINTPATVLVRMLVAIYRGTLGLWLGGHCRYEPSCSQYLLDAVAKHGPWRGAWRGLKRIARCHPWGGFGHDPA
jgi:putative membrane protein insertion efficiency factor